MHDQIGAAELWGGREGRGEGRWWTRGSFTTCFSPEAEGAEGALSMPDVEMGNQLATAVIYILPTWEGERGGRASESGSFHGCLRRPSWQAPCRML